MRFKPMILSLKNTYKLRNSKVLKIDIPCFMTSKYNLNFVICELCVLIFVHASVQAISYHGVYGRKNFI